MNHRLNAYKDNNIWITYCEKCSKEADELLGSDCAGQVEPFITERARNILKEIPQFSHQDTFEKIVLQSCEKSAFLAYSALDKLDIII